MSKKTQLAAALVLFAAGVPAMAGSNTATLTVGATLTPVCTIGATDITLNYTSMQTTDVSNTGALTVTCTKGQGYSLAISAPAGKLVGLDYTVALVDDGGTVITGGTGTGAANSTKQFVKATIAKDQSGDVSGLTNGATYTATSAAHTVTLTY